MVRAPFKRRRRRWLIAVLIPVALAGCWQVEPDLQLSTNQVNFGPDDDSTTITIRNDSKDKIITSGVETLEYQLKCNRAWLTVSPASGSCGAGESSTHTIAVNRSLMNNGENVGTISATSNGGSGTIEVTAVRVQGACTESPSVPESPGPDSGATGVPVGADVSWQGGDSRCDGLTATYDIYFGTSSPAPFRRNNGTAKQWDPGTLAANTRYYWRIVAKDANGGTTGPEWTFGTVCTQGPATVNLVSPANGAIDVPVNEDLDWGGGNSQCTELGHTYDVYFGTTSPPPFSDNTSITSWDPGVLAKETTYYWRIVAKDTNGSVSSETRSFTTEEVACLTKASAVALVSPAANATNVPTTQLMTWSGGESQCPGLTATYDVYFGTTSPAPFHHNNGTGKQWDSGTLAANTRYYWRIVAKDANGETASSTFWFSTRCDLLPEAPCSPGPTNGKTNVNPKANLEWECGDSRCGLLVSYDVYLGSSSNLGEADKLGTSVDNEWNLPDLEGNTTYYWKVVARDESGSTSSPVWSFRTRGGGGGDD